MVISEFLVWWMWVGTSEIVVTIKVQIRKIERVMRLTKKHYVYKKSIMSIKSNIADNRMRMVNIL